MSNDKRYPRVLVISLNAFSKGNSNNGKVLSQYFCDWDTDTIAQFYIMNELPDSPVCNRYYRVTDKGALKSFLTGKKYGRRIEATKSEPNSDTGAGTLVRSSAKKTGFNRLARDIVWNSGRWRGRDFDNWIDEFNPEILLVMVGGSSFIPKLALNIAKKRNIPLVIYNTESYYFDRVKGFNLWGRLYRRGGRRALRRLMAASSHEIYLNGELNRLYKDEFGKEGSVLYQSTSFVPDKSFTANDVPIFSYAGNINLGRHKSLIELALALQEISPDYKLDIYGSTEQACVKEELETCDAIRYHGSVPYDTVVSVINESDFLVHAESFDDETVKMLRTAFTTKIGDSLASGKPFIVYAHASLACSKYLTEHDCACVITEKEMLSDKLRELIGREELRRHYVSAALKTAQTNHNVHYNCEQMRKILLTEVEKHNENMSD